MLGQHGDHYLFPMASLANKHVLMNESSFPLQKKQYFPYKPIMTGYCFFNHSLVITQCHSIFTKHIR